MTKLSKAARIRQHPAFPQYAAYREAQAGHMIANDLRKYGVCYDDVYAATRSRSSKRGRPQVLERCSECGQPKGGYQHARSAGDLEAR